MASFVPRITSGSEWLKPVDRLHWTAGLSATCFGVRVGVRVNDEGWLPALQEHLPPGWQASSSPEVDLLYSMRLGGAVDGTRIRRFHLGFAGPSRFVRTLDVTEAHEAFESAVRYDVAVAARPWVFVHAGVVGIDGQAVVIPGPSTSGKTTLVEAFVRAGAVYYSDEYAVIGEDGCVYPFARRLSIRDADGRATRVSASELRAVTGVTPLPIGVIISTRYEAGVRWSPRRGSSGDAVLALFGNAIRARLEPAAVLRTLTRAVEHATLLDGPRGEAAAVSREIFRMRSHAPSTR